MPAPGLPVPLSAEFLHETSGGLAGNVPTPGCYYAIQFGAGGLLTTAGRAYGVGAGAQRLRWAQQVNAHPLNRRFWRPPANDFERKYFGQGIVSFNPIFTCSSEQRRAGRGERRCFAKIWMPPARPYYHPLLGQGVPVNRTEEPIESNRSESELDEGISSDEVAAGQRIDTTKTPYRWICKVAIFATHPKHPSVCIRMPSCSGTLIGPRHVLVAAHSLHYWLEDDPSTLFDVAKIFVAPGASGLRRPFFWSKAQSWDVHPKWRACFDPRFDFGLIKLKRALGDRTFRKTSGKPLGFWGSAEYGDGTILRPVQRHPLRGAKLNICGYSNESRDRPKLVSAAVRSINPAAGPVNAPELITYDAGTSDGHSGAPVWYWDDKTNTRRLVAVHQGGCNQLPLTSCVSPCAAPCVDGKRPMDDCVLMTVDERTISVPRMGVVITQDVVDRINMWKKQL